MSDTQSNRLPVDELVAKVADVSGLTKKDTKVVLNALGGVVKAELAAGSKVYIPEVGSLKTRTRKALSGGPNAPAKDRKVVEVTTIAFKASRGLKEEVR